MSCAKTIKACCPLLNTKKVAEYNGVQRLTVERVFKADRERFSGMVYKALDAIHETNVEQAKRV